MSFTLTSSLTLNNGVEMPRFGLGVWRTEPGTETVDAVGWALDAGYRHIDTAMGYSNESDVGQAVRASGVPREEIFVTSKITTGALSYDGTVAALDDSMGKLDIGYVDLYLIHWPVNDWQGAWRALEEANRDGRVRAIGVSNFMEHHLDTLLGLAEIRPTVNQFEYHPYLQQPNLVKTCRDNDIAITSWAPLMKGKVVDEPTLNEIASKYGKTAVQVTIRWMLQTDIITIPKSARKERIESNADVFDFELSAEDIATINGLDRDGRIGPHPDTVGR